MKKRIIACVVACAMLLMGSGYAYWTDLINVSAQADTGDLNVDFTAANYLSNNFEATNAALPESAYDSTGRTVSFTNNNVTLGISDLYPGHYEIFDTTVDNVGTVAAKLGKIDATLTGNNSEARNLIGIAIAATSEYDTTQVVSVPYYGWKLVWVGCGRNRHQEWVWDIVGSHDETITVPVNGDVALGLPTGSTFVIDGIIFVRLSSLPDLDVNEQTSNILYLTNDSTMNFQITVGMDPDRDGAFTTGRAQARTNKNDADSENQYEAVTLGLIWDQYNEQ